MRLPILHPFWLSLYQIAGAHVIPRPGRRIFVTASSPGRLAQERQTVYDEGVSKTAAPIFTGGARVFAEKGPAESQALFRTAPSAWLPFPPRLGVRFGTLCPRTMKEELS